MAWVVAWVVAPGRGRARHQPHDPDHDPDPAPGRGQLVLAVRRCGICGSDLHATEHGDALAEVMDELGYAHSIRRDNHVVLGHEIVGEVVGRGRGAGRGLREGVVSAAPVGTRVRYTPLELRDVAGLTQLDPPRARPAQEVRVA